MSADPFYIPEFTMGDRMRLALRARGVSVLAMAEYMGVSRTTISNWINGRGTPRLADLRVWAMRTGVPLSWLQTGVEPEGPDGGVQLPHLDSNQKPFGMRFGLAPAA